MTGVTTLPNLKNFRPRKFRAQEKIDLIIAQMS